MIILMRKNIQDNPQGRELETRHKLDGIVESTVYVS
jgi:hypothetical protein